MWPVKSRISASCGLCSYPMIDGGMPLVLANLENLSDWMFAHLGLSIDHEQLRDMWCCLNCIREARRFLETTEELRSEDFVWWPHHDDPFYEYYLKGWIRPCAVKMEKMTDEDILKHVNPEPAKQLPKSAKQRRQPKRTKEGKIWKQRKVWKCKSCSLSFFSRGDLLNHVPNHSDLQDITVKAMTTATKRLAKVRNSLKETMPKGPKKSSKAARKTLKSVTPMHLVKEFSFTRSYYKLEESSCTKKKSTFSCTSCELNLTRIEWAEHLEGLKCLTCSDVLPCRVRMMEHMRNVHYIKDRKFNNAKTWACDICQNLFVSEISLEVHKVNDCRILIHDPEGWLKTGPAEYAANQPLAGRENDGKALDSSKGAVRKRIPFRMKLFKGLLPKTDYVQYQCQNCDLRLTNIGWESHYKKLSCTVCHQILKCKTELIFHLKTEHEIGYFSREFRSNEVSTWLKPWTCTTCQENFPTHAELETHQASPDCKKEALQIPGCQTVEETLKSRVEGELVAEKSLSVKAIIKREIIICEHCHSWIEKSSLVQHRQPIDCEFCSKCYACENLYYKHLKESYNCKYRHYTCKICSFVFLVKSSLLFHMKACDKPEIIEEVLQPEVVKKVYGPAKCKVELEPDMEMEQTAFACGNCNRHLTLSKWSTHMSSLTCKECKEQFNCETDMTTHIRLSHSVHFCTICKPRALFATEEKLYRHLALCHPLPSKLTNVNTLNCPTLVKDTYSEPMEQANAVLPVIPKASGLAEKDAATIVKQTEYCKYCGDILVPTMSQRQHELLMKCQKLTRGHFECDVCGDEFVYKGKLIQHFVDEVHAKVSLYKCSDCYIFLRSKWLLTAHLNKKHGIAPETISSQINGLWMSKAEKINSLFGQNAKSEMSEADKLLNNALRCQNCYVLFKSAEALRNHYCPMRKIGSCGFCLQSMYWHFSNSHSMPQYCGDCECTFPCMGLILAHNSGCVFQCPYCQQKFCTRDVFENHVIYGHAMSFFKLGWERLEFKNVRMGCKFCKIYFVDNREKADHVATYHSDNMCPLCGDSVVGSDVRGHLRDVHLMHVKVRNPRATVTSGIGVSVLHIGKGKEFVYKYGMVSAVHELENDTKFVCGLCKKKFALKKAAENHMLFVHLNLKYHCKLCIYVTASFENFIVHRDMHKKVNMSKVEVKNGDMISCHICKDCFRTGRQYDAHVEQKHKENAINVSQGALKYSCPKCDHSFDNYESFVEHAKIRPTMQECSECSAIVQINLLNLHFQHCHRVYSVASDVEDVEELPQQLPAVVENDCVIACEVETVAGVKDEIADVD